MGGIWSSGPAKIAIVNITDTPIADDIDNIEFTTVFDFLEEILWRSLWRNHRDSLRLILMNKRAKKFFIKFLFKKWNYSGMSSIADISDWNGETLSLSLDSFLYTNNENLRVENSMHKKIITMIPDFLESDCYEKWRLEERDQVAYVYNTSSNNIPTTIPEILDEETVPELQTMKKAKAVQSMKPVFANIKVHMAVAKYSGAPTAMEVDELPGQAKSSGDTTNDVLKYVDHLEIRDIMKCKKTLFDMLTIVENMPVSFSLATANTQRRGFPLIYVNKQFERLTGYKRTEVIGKNPKFLQKFVANDWKRQMATSNSFAAALRNGQKVTHRITNFRQDGEKYECLVALKPLFDDYGLYLYVASFQFEVPDEPVSSQSKCFIDTIMNGLPDFV